MKLTIRLNLDTLINTAFTDSFFLHFENITALNNWYDEEEIVTGLDLQVSPTQKIMYVYLNGESLPSYDERDGAITDLSSTNDYIVFNCVIADSSMNRVIDFINKGIIEVELNGKTVIYAYRLNDEKDKLTKALTPVTILEGNFKAPLGIKNIELDVVNYDINNSYNYVYIPKLNRYFYITNIQLTTKDFTRLLLQEDVLMSWKDLIKLQSALVTRYENSTNTKLVDNRQPLEDVLTVEFRTMTSITGGKKNIDITFNTRNIPNILIVTRYYSDIPDNWYNHNETPSLDSGYLPELLPHNIPNIQLFFMNNNVNDCDLSWFIWAGMRDDATMSYLDSILILPFDPSTAFHLIKTQQYQDFYIGNKHLKRGTDGGFVDRSETLTGTNLVRGYKTANPTGEQEVELYQSAYLCVFDGYFYESDGWEKHEPYCNYELYIPFVGYVKMNSYDVINKLLTIYYIMDVKDGSATAYVYNRSDHKVIWSGTCQIAVKLDVTKTNLLETTKQRQSNDLNMVLGLISSALSIGVGVVSENPVAIAGGVLSAGKTIASNVNANRMLFNRAQTTYGSGDASFYSIQDVHMKITKNAKMVQLSTIYNKLQGLPYNMYVALSGLTGYVEIGDMHFDAKGYNIYSDEITEIVQLLKNGVIL